MKFVRALRWWPLSILLAAAPLAWAVDVPVGPDRPRSSQECVEIFDPVFKDHYRNRGCRHCDDMAGWPGQQWANRYTACYSQCTAKGSSEHKQIMDARQACFLRAKANANEVEQARLQKLEGMKLGEKLNEAYTDVIKAGNALTSPRRFFERAMAKMSRETVNTVMGYHKADPITVEAQIHKYAFTQARAGIEAASLLRKRSDLIGQIQHSALDRLEDVHQDMLREFNTAMSNANTIVASSYGAPTPTFRPTPMRSYGPAPTLPSDPRCQVLETKESSDLAIEQPELFEELSARCRRSAR